VYDGFCVIGAFGQQRFSDLTDCLVKILQVTALLEVGSDCIFICQRSVPVKLKLCIHLSVHLKKIPVQNNR